MPTAPEPAPRPAPSFPKARATRQRIWDLPTRLFHWALAVTVTGLLVTGLNGIMEWHFRLGYATLALLLFRLLWGFVGGRWSRFATFAYGPGAVLAYLRGRASAEHRVGHSPLGALSVFVMLAVLVLQVATGLTSDDAITYAGPLAGFVSSAVVDWSTGWHAVRGKWAVFALIGLHLMAVLFYVVVRRRSLVRPMFSGDQLLDGPVVPSRDDTASRMLALALFAACGGAAFWVSTLRA
ncbi:MAG: cytochrome B [Variovorax sp.]|nr:MAG: cytochrome B [Variovorax sp.]